MDNLKAGRVEKPLDRARTNMIRDVDEFLNTPVRHFILALTRQINTTSRSCLYTVTLSNSCVAKGSL